MSAYPDLVSDPGFLESNPVSSENIKAETGEGFFRPFSSLVGRRTIRLGFE
jgi:hypothetical protein